MKSKQSRKPTNNELKVAINNLIMEIGYIQQGIRSIDSILSAYIDWNKDTNKFRDWLKDQYQKEKNEQEQNVGKSIRGDKETKVGSIKPERKDTDSSS